MPGTTMGLMGRKLGMTQIFQDDGTAVPVTVIDASGNTVVQVKNSDTRDGYAAVQVGFGERRAVRSNRALNGHAKKAEIAAPRFLREFRLTDADTRAYSPGQAISPSDLFASGQRVDVTGESKGRGFAGVMKRHNFSGFERTHGVHEYFRHGGSIGTRLTPGMTLKGKGMPGQMGASRVTVQNVHIVKIDAERNLIFLRGGVPGPDGAMVLIRRSTKDAARAAHKAAKK